MDPSRDAARDLLFGLLALQTGLIDQAKLLAAFHGWATDGTAAMPRVLLAMGAIEESDVALIQGLVARHLRAGGGAPDRTLGAMAIPEEVRDALARVASATPDDGIASTLAMLAKAPKSGDAPPKTVPAGVQAPPEDASRTATYRGDAADAGPSRFRVLRSHARGGLGEVSVALDTELEREVALKEILPEIADDAGVRGRFLREAHVTGNLEHPGIAPVYSLGTRADGRPYYAMRFIRGDSLRQKIADFHADEALARDPGRKSLALRQLLGRLLDVINTVEYAHGRGVLHRDIKPSNVVVGRHGETLLVDWGLAKLMDQADEAPGAGTEERRLSASGSTPSTQTVAGVAVGTPSYMSPEQADGRLDLIGRRSDVYSLGATLYHLITGRAPFEGPVLEVLSKVRRGDFRPPRALAPSCHRSLEAVCLKAMAMKPEDRYGSAAELAEDLERWLADQPVLARREPLAERGRRWARTHRATVATAIAALVVATAGLAGMSAVQARANRDLRTSNLRERERFQVALEAIETFHGGVTADVLLKQSEFKDLRHRLLTDAKKFYDRLAGMIEGQDDPDSRRALGRAYFGVGELDASVAGLDEALAAHRRALAVRRDLAAARPADREAQADVARSLIEIGYIEKNINQKDEALRDLTLARGILEPLASAGPDVNRYRRELARCLTILGQAVPSTASIEEAQAYYQEALRARETMRRTAPDDLSVTIGLAESHIAMGMHLSTYGRRKEALEQLALAREEREEVLARLPGDLEAVHGLCRTLNCIGMIAKWDGRIPEAIETLERSRDLMRGQVQDYPAVLEFQRDLARAEHQLGTALSQAGRADDALAAFGRARAIQESIIKTRPNMAEFRDELGLTLFDTGWTLHMAGRPEAALAAHREALKVREALTRDFPGIAGYPYNRAVSRNNVASLLVILGRLPEAADASRKASEALAEVSAANPNAIDVRRDLARCLNSLGMIHALVGLHEEARGHYQKALEAADSTPSNPELLRERIPAWLGIGLAQLKLGRPARALGPLLRGLEAVTSLSEADENDVRSRAERLTATVNLAIARRLTGDPSGAEQLCRDAIGQVDLLPKPLPDDRYARSRALAQLAAVRGTPTRAAIEGVVAALRSLALPGFPAVSELEQDPAFDPIRGEPSFQLFLYDRTFPPDPFAR